MALGSAVFTLAWTSSSGDTASTGIVVADGSQHPFWPDSGGIYGIPVEDTLAAMRLAASLEGMITDPVYEGKSMAGHIGLVTGGEIGKG